MFATKADFADVERLTIDTVNDDGCLNLLEMFLTQLSEDYRFALDDFMRNQKNKKSKKGLMWLRQFIRSNYFASLTGLDGSEVISTLDGKYKTILEGFDV